MTKFYDAVYSFERVGGLSIRKALHINVWEMAWVTAMAAGGEQTRSAHARDVSLGARIYSGLTRQVLVIYKGHQLMSLMMPHFIRW